MWTSKLFSEIAQGPTRIHPSIINTKLTANEIGVMTFNDIVFSKVVLYRCKLDTRLLH